MIWHKAACEALRASGLFREVRLMGAKVRGILDETRFVDIHYDPTTGSYSYALIDLRLPFAGDKRLLGWDDYPQEGVIEIEALSSYPHHFQRRAEDGGWIYEASPVHGNIHTELEIILAVIRTCLSG